MYTNYAHIYKFTKVMKDILYNYYFRVLLCAVIFLVVHYLSAAAS